MVAVPIVDGKDLLDFANWIYQCNLAGEDDGNYPRLGAVRRRPAPQRRLLDQVLNIIVARDAFGRGSVLFTSSRACSPAISRGQLNDLLVKIVVSMSVDNNCPDDNDKTILLEGSSAQGASPAGHRQQRRRYAGVRTG